MGNPPKVIPKMRKPQYTIRLECVFCRRGREFETRSLFAHSKNPRKKGCSFRSQVLSLGTVLATLLQKVRNRSVWVLFFLPFCVESSASLYIKRMEENKYIGKGRVFCRNCWNSCSWCGGIGVCSLNWIGVVGSKHWFVFQIKSIWLSWVEKAFCTHDSRLPIKPGISLNCWKHAFYLLAVAPTVCQVWRGQKLNVRGNFPFLCNIHKNSFTFQTSKQRYCLLNQKTPLRCLIYNLSH